MIAIIGMLLNSLSFAISAATLTAILRNRQIYEPNTSRLWLGFAVAGCVLASIACAGYVVYALSLMARGDGSPTHATGQGIQRDGVKVKG